MAKAISKKKKFLAIFLIVLVVLAGLIWFYYFGKKYDFYNYANAEVEIPGLNDGFCPQGLCAIDSENAYLVSGYMKDTSKPSRIYYVNKDGVKKHILVDTKTVNLNNGHFGGIAMFGSMVYLVSDGYLFNFKLEDIISSTDGQTIATIDIFETKINTDFCYAKDNLLYIGEFYKQGKYEVSESHYVKINDNEINHGITLCYQINTSKIFGLESTKPIKAISVPDQAQGLCMTDSGKIVVSTSYSLPDSKILVYNNPTKSNEKININNDELDLYVLSNSILIKTIVAPCMSEGIDYEDGKVHILFESACTKYRLFTRVREKNILSISEE